MNEKTGLSWFFNTHRLITDLKIKKRFFCYPIINELLFYRKLNTRTNQAFNSPYKFNYNPLCINVGICCILFNKLSAWCHIIAHEHGENVVGCSCILDSYLTQSTVIGIHGRVPKLNFVHFTQPFVTLGMNTCFAAATVFFNKSLALLFSPEIFLYFSFLVTIKLIK